MLAVVWPECWDDPRREAEPSRPLGSQRLFLTCRAEQISYVCALSSECLVYVVNMLRVSYVETRKTWAFLYPKPR